jgi:hypothetical protein
MGQLLAGHGLLIAAMHMGSPIVDDVTQLLYANAGLAAAVRDGSVGRRAPARCGSSPKWW